MVKRLTIKQKKFVRKLVELGNGTQAALDAYDTKSPQVASVIASENLAKPNVRRAVEEAFDRSGLTLDYVSGKLKDAMEAGMGVKAKNSDTIRAAELLLKVFGAFPGRRAEVLKIGVQERVKQMSYGELVQENQKVRRLRLELTS